MTTRTNTKPFVILLLRGVLGGALGAFVRILISVNPITFGSTWAEWLIFGYLVLGLPTGVFIGAMAATVIWMTYRRTRKNLGPVKRAIIGIIVAMIVSAIVDALTRPVGYPSRSLLERLIGLILFAAMTGGTTGLVIGRQISSPKSNVSESS